VDSVSIVISRQATGPTPPSTANAMAPNALRTRVAEVVAQMGRRGPSASSPTSDSS